MSNAKLSANTQVVNLVENEVLKWMQARTSFTALDISNALKSDNWPVRHREVAEVVRDIWTSGAMQHYDYSREMIDVTTDGGTKQVQAWVYVHSTARADDYTTLHQDALPPVAAAQARDLSDSVSADPAGVLAHARQTTTTSARTRTATHRRRGSGSRQDGALPVPRRIIAQLGWTDGDLLEVRVDANVLRVEVSSGSAGAPGTNAALSGINGSSAATAKAPARVWSGRRVRICKSKLRLCALDADAVTVSVDGSSLRIAPLP